MDIHSNPSNAALAYAAVARLDAEARVTNAMAALWRLGGVGALVALIGAGAGMALWGVAQLYETRNTAERLSTSLNESIQKALASTTIKATGEFAIKPDQQVALAPGGEVSLDPNAQVKIDPASTVDVRGTITANAPRVQHRDFESTATEVAPRGKITTNFTVFKASAYERGEVSTGWVYESSEQDAPSYQYCMYKERLPNGVVVKVDIARNGTLNSNLSAAQKRSVNVQAAFPLCTWF